MLVGASRQLIDAVKEVIVPFIRAADEAAPLKSTGQLVPNSQGVTRNVLVRSRKPDELVKELSLSLPDGEGRGEDGLLRTIRDVLEHSVNTWDQGFLDKLYASTNAVGVVSELLLSVLNTNVGLMLGNYQFLADWAESSTSTKCLLPSR